MKHRIFLAAVGLCCLLIGSGCEKQPPQMNRPEMERYIQDQLPPAMECLEWCLGQGLPARTDAAPLSAGGRVYYPSAHREIDRAGELWDACQPYLTEEYFAQLVGDLSSPGGRYYETGGLLYLDPAQARAPMPHTFFESTAVARTNEAGQVRLSIEYQLEENTPRQYNDLDLVWRDGSWKVEGRWQLPVPV